MNVPVNEDSNAMNVPVNEDSNAMNVLFTRTLSDFDIRLCAELGIVAHTKPLMASFPRGIETILANHPDLWETLNSVTAVAFTSQQAVDALFLSPNSGAGTALLAQTPSPTQILIPSTLPLFHVLLQFYVVNLCTPWANRPLIRWMFTESWPVFPKIIMPPLWHE
jgi:hypothetical protein